MTVSREPLAAREGEDRTLREGIPASLEPSLREWIEGAADLDATEAEHALIRLDLELPDSAAVARTVDPYRILDQSGGPARSASRTTGTRPASAIRLSSSNTEENAAAA